MVLLADTPCTPGMKPDTRNGSGHRHRNVAVGTDPQRDGRGKPAECLCPDDAPAKNKKTPLVARLLLELILLKLSDLFFN